MYVFATERYVPRSELFVPLAGCQTVGPPGALSQQFLLITPPDISLYPQQEPSMLHAPIGFRPNYFPTACVVDKAVTPLERQGEAEGEAEEPSLLLRHCHGADLLFINVRTLAQGDEC